MTQADHRKSVSVRGHRAISVVQYTDGEIIMTIVDRRALTLEDIPLKKYIDAEKVVYSPQHGWMYEGSEIPRLY